jgi:thioredoxin reductase/ferredoxin
MRMNPVTRYARWLHTKWPAGAVEKLPRVREDGSTNVPGLYVVGDLTGVPLLKFSSDTGARVIQKIAGDREREPSGSAAGPGSRNALDLLIIGAGVSGMAAALEAKKLGLSFEIIESSESFFTVVNFPARKPIYTYPSGMTPAGDLQFRDDVHPKETLLEDLRRETRDITPRRAAAESVTRKGDLLQVNLEGGEPPLLARRVIVAIGRSGNYRKLDVPGEDLDKVYNRLHDPKDFAGRKIVVVGGGDSALETAIALAEVGCDVTIAYRGAQFSRPKPDNLERLAALPIRARFGTRITEIRPAEVVFDGGETLANDFVFTMIGREPPLEFFRKSGVKIGGEWRVSSVLGLLAFLAFCVFVYHWKKSGTPLPIAETFSARQWFPFNLRGDGWLAITLRQPGFYYSLAYTLIVIVFGWRRIAKRPTPYIKWQTATLAAIQLIPLFILPYFLLPWMGAHGWFDSGPLAALADQLFPRVNYAHGREYWRAFGLLLAWPLFIWNVFTDQPMWLWLAISFLQTFVLIPLIIYFWGKGAYCGWICSCGALAETLGDAHRHKMPHGPFWNRLNLAGQAILLFAFVILFARVLGWIGFAPADRAFKWLLLEVPLLNYAYSVDLILAGIIGVGLYFHFSGRVWCRFFCPLAALMHIYHRFSRFRILADKKKCISCNVCTSVCHQGIDVMSFANKGEPMADPQCVRCSACVAACPTGVLSFGQVDPKTEAPIKTDPAWLAASPVLMREIGVNGRRVSVQSRRSDEALNRS